MRRPWATRLPKKGGYSVTRDGCWYFFRAKWLWRQPTRFVWRAWADGPPRDWKHQLYSERYTVKKPDKPAGDAVASPPHFLDPMLKREHPKLYEAMSASAYEDGSKKGPGLLIIKGRSRVVSLLLKIEGSGLLLRCEADTYSAALKALEALLSLDVVPWEDDLYSVVKPPKKGKG